MHLCRSPGGIITHERARTRNSLPSVFLSFVLAALTLQDPVRLRCPGPPYRLPRRDLHRPPGRRRDAEAHRGPHGMRGELGPPLALGDVAQREPKPCRSTPTTTRPIPDQVSSQPWSSCSPGARGGSWRKPRAAVRRSRTPRRREAPPRSRISLCSVVATTARSTRKAIRSIDSRMGSFASAARRPALARGPVTSRGTCRSGADSSSAAPSGGATPARADGDPGLAGGAPGCGLGHRRLASAGPVDAMDSSQPLRREHVVEVARLVWARDLDHASSG
jgi:hypothetical protein